MKYVYLLVVLVIVFLVGCNPSPTDTTEVDGNAVKVQDAGDDINMVVETDDGTVEITASGTDNDDWCQAGAQWTMTSSADDANAQWIIDRLETGGEYAGYCHVLYTAQSPEGDVRIDYWFDESGENGYYEMDIAGQKIKQEWTG